MRSRPFQVRAAALATAVLLLFCLHMPRRDVFRVDFLDVGQGDGICVSDGEGHHVFLDGGSSSEGQAGIYRILPFLRFHRIGAVDAWIVTHTDEDHISGLLEILEEGYPVKLLLFAEAVPRDEAWENLVIAAKNAGTRVRYASAGDGLDLSGARMDCLYPAVGETGTDKNGLSQVWRLQRNGFSFLLTGDIGEEQEKLLLQRGQIAKTDVLKAAHHGSNYSSCREFLEAASPGLTVISCSEGNRYGHPGREALERLVEAGSEILITKDTGQITVKEGKEGFSVRLPCEQ